MAPQTLLTLLPRRQEANTIGNQKNLNVHYEYYRQLIINIDFILNQTINIITLLLHLFMYYLVCSVNVEVNFVSTNMQIPSSSCCVLRVLSHNDHQLSAYLVLRMS